MSFTKEEKQHLLSLANRSIRHGLEHHRAAPVAPDDLKDNLGEPGASFVTLLRGKRLRGCIGCLEAHRPLAEDVSENAYASAFHDRRFKPLQAEELANLHIKISVLTLPLPMIFDSEVDLLQQLQPGIDGLILTDGYHRGTFLPSVWESLPKPQDFFNNLKRKAGLSPEYWSSTLQIQRYTTMEFGEDDD